MSAPLRPIPRRKYFRTPATAPGPSGPEMLPSFGAIRRNPVRYLTEIWQQYGDVVQFPVPRPPAYLVNDPDGVRQVLVGEAKNYGKNTIQYRSLSLVTGEGLLTADTEAWRRQRPLVQPAFHHETLGNVALHSAAVAKQLFEPWRTQPTGTVVDVDHAMMQAALNVVGRSLFGTDLSGDARQLTGATLDALDVVIARARPSIPPPPWLPTKSNRKLHRALRILDDAVAGILAERNSDVSRQDIVALLRGSATAQGERLSDAEIRNQLVTFIVAGHETVAAALTWSLALLAAHPEVQQRLHAEAATVLTGEGADFADFARLPYARAVFDESLRLYPSAWLITRNALAEAELGGYLVPAGSLVILSPWLLHRHPDLWQRPEAFDPQRFVEQRYERTAFIPFGAGPRQCIGKDFAYVEAVLLLALMAREFSFAYPPGRGMPDFEPLVTVRPVNGVPLEVRPR